MWHRLTESLPPTEKEEDITFDSLLVCGKETIIHNRVSKPVLLRSRHFKELCRKEFIGANDFESEHLVGTVTIEDVTKGKSGNDADDHRIVVSIAGMDNMFAIKGKDDSGIFSTVFDNENDIEWLDMDEL